MNSHGSHSRGVFREISKESGLWVTVVNMTTHVSRHHEHQMMRRQPYENLLVIHTADHNAVVTV